jgi:hypothetical protein
MEETGKGMGRETVIAHLSNQYSFTETEKYRKPLSRETATQQARTLLVRTTILKITEVSQKYEQHSSLQEKRREGSSVQRAIN